MCLGVPGRVTKREENALGMTMGTVDFGGIRKQVCLAWVPEAREGDWVVVHVGFAISQIDEEEARKVFDFLRSMGELADLELPAEGAPATARAVAPSGAACPAPFVSGLAPARAGEPPCDS